MLKKPAPDWIHVAVVRRCRELGLSGYALAKRSGLRQQHVSDYLAGRKSMTSRLLAPLMKELGLTVRPAATVS